MLGSILCAVLGRSTAAVATPTELRRRLREPLLPVLTLALASLAAAARPVGPVAAPPQDPPPASGQQAPPTAEELQELINKARGLRAQRKYVEAVEATRVAQQALRRGGYTREAIIMHAWSADCHHALERYDEELTALEQGRRELVEALGEAEAGDLLPKFLIDLSICLRRLGRSSEAVGEAHEAVRVSGSGMEPELRAKASNTLGMAELAAGRPADALLAFEGALALLPPPHPRRGAVTYNIAGTLAVLGNAEKALERYDAVLAGLGPRAVDDPRFLTQIHRGRAVALFDLGRYAEAARSFERVLAALNAPGLQDTLEAAGVRGDLAFCLIKLGRPQEALELVREALTAARARLQGDHPDIARLLTGQASSQRDLGRLTGDRELLDRATKTYEEASAMGRRLAAPETQVTLTALAGHLLDNEDDAEGAAGLFREAVAEVEVLRSRASGLDDVRRAAYFRQLRALDPFEGMARAMLRLDRAEEAVRYLELGRARSALDLLERSRFDPIAEARKRAERAGDQATLARIDETVRAIEATELQLSRLERGSAAPGSGDAEAQAAFRSAQDRLRALLRERAELTEGLVRVAQPAELAAIRAVLGEDQRLLFYLLGEESHVFLVPPPGREIVHAPLLNEKGASISEAEIRSAVIAYRDAIRSPGPEEPERGRPPGRPPTQSSPIETGHRLFRMLVPPAVWDEVRAASLVYVIPHGALHLCPFEAFVVEHAAGSDPTYWLDVGPSVAYAPSGSVLAWSVQRRDEQARQEALPDVLVIADPVFDELPPLPGTRKEASGIHAAVEGASAPPSATPAPRVVARLGPDATETALYELAARARVVHIATHQVPDEHGRWSAGRIVLARVPEATDLDDGFLDLDDLLLRWRGRLAGCEMVVISSCRSRLGTLSEDEGIFGFPWGFHYAGCPTVIASLWPVSDAATAELMPALYADVAQGGAGTRLASFTEARRALRRRHPEPFYWAPFVWIGAPR